MATIRAISGNGIDAVSYTHLVNFGIFAPLDRNYKKAERKKMRASRALAKIKAIAGELDE